MSEDIGSIYFDKLSDIDKRFARSSDIQFGDCNFCDEGRHPAGPYVNRTRFLTSRHIANRLERCTTPAQTNRIFRRLGPNKERRVSVMMARNVFFMLAQSAWYKYTVKSRWHHNRKQWEKMLKCYVRAVVVSVMSRKWGWTPELAKRETFLLLLGRPMENQDAECFAKMSAFVDDVVDEVYPLFDEPVGRRSIADRVAKRRRQ